MGKQRPVIAVIDDDLPIVHLLEEVLSDEGYTVQPVYDTGMAYSDVKRIAPDLVILDVHLGIAGSGWDVLAQLRADPVTTTTPVILCTAGSRDMPQLADQRGLDPTWVVAKPFELDSLLATIATALT